MGRLHPSVDDSSRVAVIGERELHARGRSAEIIRAFPWSLTPLGPIEQWDACFISHLDLMLEAHFPMFLTWGQDDHLFYNDAFESVLVGKGDCIGRPMHTVFAEAWPQIRPFVRNALQGQASYIEDLPVALVRNGTLTSTWWSGSYSPARAEEGAVGGVLGVLYETTRRIAAEQTLRLSEAELLAVTDMAPGLLWRCNAEGWLNWANPGLNGYLGLGSIAGVRWNDNVHPDDVETGRSIYSLCMQTGRPFECQQRLRGADGLYRWFMIRAQQVLGANGEVTAWCGSASDVDDWRRAANDLHEREDLMHRFYESEATLMWAGTVATREIEAFNPECRKSWALPEDGRPIVWETWLSFAHVDDRPQLSILFDRAATGEIAQTRFRSGSATGAVRRFHATAFSMPDGSDGARRVGGLIVEVASNDDPRIYLVDSHSASQNALAHSLTRKGFRVRAFNDEDAFKKIAADLAPGCVVLAVRDDFEMTLKTAAVLKSDRRLPWVAIGDFTGRLHDVVQLMKLGAADILTRPDPEDVSKASHAALAVAFGKAKETRAPADAIQKIHQLSPRERQVFEGLVAGGTNKSIGKALGLSYRTVETHRAHLMDRLSVSTLAELVKLASDGGVSVRG